MTKKEARKELNILKKGRKATSYGALFYMRKTTGGLYSIWERKGGIEAGGSGGGYRVRSYVTGILGERVYKTREAAQNAAATSKKEARRKRR